MKISLRGKQNLFLRTALGFALGIAAGALLPEFSLKIRFIGDVYLSLIKMMILPVVICAVFCG